MGVEIITDNVPADGLGIGGYHRLQMGQEIGFCACGSTGRSHDLAAGNIPAHNQGTCAMAYILKFAPLDKARSQGQSWVLALKRLDSSQLIGTHCPLSLLSQDRGLLIHLT